MTEENGPVRLVSTPPEMARLLRLLMGKGGSGSSPFDRIGLTVRAENGGTVVEAEHMNRMTTMSLRAAYYGASGDGAGSFGLAQPEKVIDFLDGLFAAGAPVELRFDPVLGRVDLTGAGNRASMATVPFAEIPRTKKEDIWTQAKDGTWLQSSPATRPPPSSDWAAWVEAGYLVALISRIEFDRILSAGSILTSHGLKAALATFDFPPATKEADAVVEISDPKDPKGEVVRLEIDAPKARPKGGDSFSVLFSGVSALWESQRNSKAESFLLTHYPGGPTAKAENRVNLSFWERKDDGTPVLQYTSVFARHTDPRNRRITKDEVE